MDSLLKGAELLMLLLVHSPLCKQNETNTYEVKLYETEKYPMMLSTCQNKIKQYKTFASDWKDCKFKLLTLINCFIQYTYFIIITIELHHNLTTKKQLNSCLCFIIKRT